MTADQIVSWNRSLTGTICAAGVRVMVVTVKAPQVLPKAAKDEINVNLTGVKLDERL